MNRPGHRPRPWTTLPERLSDSGKRAVEESFTRCPGEALGFYREIREAAGEALKINAARGRRKRA